MATSETAPWFLLICALLSFSIVNADENQTDPNFNVTFGDQNVTDNFTDTNTATPDYTVPTTIAGNSEEPVQPTAGDLPLPVSGQLLTPVTDVGRLCPCDVQGSACDINCCCDKDCGEEVALFTSCTVRTVSGNKQLCSSAVASYSLATTVDGHSEVQSSVRKETSNNVFCIQSQNRFDGLSHPSPALPTDSNFDSLFQKFTSFAFGSEVNSGQMATDMLHESNGYQFGDQMETAGQSGERKMFTLPAPGVTTECVGASPAAFLKDERRVCSRRVVMEQDCGTMAALNMDTYSNIQLFSGKNKDAAVVPAVRAAVIVESVSGTQTESEMSQGESLSPVLLNADTCANVVLKAEYLIKYSSAGEIRSVAVSLVLGFVQETSLPLKQEFHISYIQQDVLPDVVRFSGNPGYVVGLPLVSGSKTSDGIVRSVNPRETLSLLATAEDQDCLRGPHRRSPILFGQDAVSGCVLRLADVSNCSLVSQQLLDILRGPNYPEYLASFGNSPQNNPLDWVQLKNGFSPGDAQSCTVPMSLQFEIEWIKYGSLVNPQSQIVSVREIIRGNTSSLTLISGGSSTLSITTSVTFVHVSANAVPGYRATPTFNAKLPFDFFFPFV